MFSSRRESETERTHGWLAVLSSRERGGMYVRANTTSTAGELTECCIAHGCTAA